MSAEIWRHLGIPQTDSEADIRRAYAERLKTTHPEDDAEGFKRLRNAYERAIEQVRWKARYAEMDAADAAFDDEEYLDNEAAPSSAPRQSRAPIPEPAVELDPELDQHRVLKQTLEEAVAAQKSPWEVQAAFQAVVTSPAMERLDVHADTEMWIANLVRRYGGGAALIDHAFKHFGWDGQNRIGDLGAGMQSFRESLAQEATSDAFIARVKGRRHEFYDAYKETTRPLKERNWLSRVLSLPRLYLVRRFLDYIDDKVPYAYDDLDYEATDWWRKRIHFWMRPLAIFGWVVRASIVVGVIALFVIFAGESEGPASSRANPQFQARQGCVASLAEWRADGAACDLYLALVPDSLLMRQYAGLIALREARFDDANAQFSEILRHAPNDPEAQYGLGLALIDNGIASDRQRGMELAQGALALDAGVRGYFSRNGVVSQPALETGVAPISPLPTIPLHDVRPTDVAVQGQHVFDEAYTYFGIPEGFTAGRVMVECLTRLTGRFSDCHIVEETPRSLGHGEVALRVMAAATVTPASLNGVPVDSVPIRVPVTFQLAPEE